MKKKHSLIILVLIFISWFSAGYKYLTANEIKDKSYMPKDGFVPNKETAIKIAEAIWIPIYGDIIYNEKPFNVELKDSVWVVQGTLKNTKGGVAYIEIKKSDCKILKVTHGK